MSPGQDFADTDFVLFIAIVRRASILVKNFAKIAIFFMLGIHRKSEKSFKKKAGHWIARLLKKSAYFLISRY